MLVPVLFHEWVPCFFHGANKGGNAESESFSSLTGEEFFYFSQLFSGLPCLRVKTFPVP